MRTTLTLALALAGGAALAQTYQEGLAAYRAQQYPTALMAWQQAATQGDANAAYGMAILTHRGLGTEADLDAARTWYSYAAELGSAEAQSYLASLPDPNRLPPIAGGGAGSQQAQAGGPIRGGPVQGGMTQITAGGAAPTPQQFPAESAPSGFERGPVQIAQGDPPARLRSPDATGFYVGAAIGLEIIGDLEYRFDLNPAVAGRETEAEVDFDTGFVVGALAGYDFGLFRLEGELGYARSEADELEIAGLGAVGFDDDIGFDPIYLLASGYVDIPTGSSIEPYVGAGVGVAFDDGITDDDETYFTAHGTAGVAFQISPDLFLGPEYRFVYVNTSEEAGAVEVEDLYAHQFRVNLRYRFAGTL